MRRLLTTGAILRMLVLGTAIVAFTAPSFAQAGGGGGSGGGGPAGAGSPQPSGATLCPPGSPNAGQTKC